MPRLDRQLDRLWRENKYLSRSLERLQISHLEKIRELSIVRQIGDTLSHLLDLKKITIDIINLILDEIDAQNCSIMLIDRSTNELILKAAKGKRDKKGKFYKIDKKSSTIFKIDQGICGLAVKGKKPVLVNDVKKYAKFLESEEKSVEIGSMISLPLITRKKVLGVINLSHPNKNFFTEDDKRILTIISSQTAIVIENAQLLMEQQWLNKQIKESEEKYKNLFKNSVESIIILSKKSKIKSYNNAFKDIINVELSEAVDKSIFKIFKKLEDRRIIRERVKQVLDSEIEILVEQRLKTDSGEKIYEIKSAPFYILGKLEGVQEIWRDITVKKELENRLNQSEKLASVGYLVSGIAHELNNPLAIILGYAELAEKFKNIPPRIKDNMLKIINAARRIRDIIQSLMSFAGERELVKIKLNINHLIKRSVDSYEDYFNKKRIKIETNLHEELPPVLGDEQQLRHVFFNLFQNAIDSMYQKNKCGYFIINSRVDSENVILELIDNGKGIRPAIKDKIFDPFFTTKDVGKGIGLGMSISYGIINNHGGELYVDHDYKNGAKFIIKLPYIDKA